MPDSETTLKYTFYIITLTAHQESLKKCFTTKNVFQSKASNIFAIT